MNAPVLAAPTAVDLEALAARVDRAARDGTAIAQLTVDHPELSIADAYEIQRLSIARRHARGERPIGLKMGLTSRAKMRQVGVDEVIWGRLTDAMRIEEGGEITLAGRIHPRVEPEIAFVMKRPLAGRVSAAEALGAVEAIVPAMEIIDSRYRDFRFVLADVVADNASSSGLVLGGAVAPHAVDVANLGIVMSFDGTAVQAGSSAAVLGHPLRALVAAARLAAEAGERLEPGAIVLAGAATEAVPLRPGVHVRTTISGLGAVAFSVGGTP